MRLIIFSCLLIVIQISVFAQKLVYDVIRSGSSMGQTVVNRTVANGQLSYHLNTKTKFRVVFSFEVEYDLVELFEEGVLVSGTGFNTLNGGIQKETKLQRSTRDYELEIDGISTRISETEIRDSVSEIYFEEPHQGKKVFSAYFGRFLEFEKTGEHQYSLTSPDGTNEYYYENGICIKVVVSRDFATFSQVLKPDLLAAVRSNKFSSVATK